MKKTVLKGLTALVLAVVVALGLGVQATLAAAGAVAVDSPLKGEVKLNVDGNVDLNRFQETFLKDLKGLTSNFRWGNPSTIGSCDDSCNKLITNQASFLFETDPLLSASACLHECYWNTDFWNKLRPNTRF